MHVAVTGGIAEGKSTVMGFIREMGYATASADDMAKEIFATSVFQQRLSDALKMPMPILATDLRARIADEPETRRLVNQLAHPQIVQKIRNSEAKFIEVPLLFETILHSAFQSVWVVTASEEIQLQRLTERLGNVKHAQALICTQLPSLVKVAFADEVVRTDETFEEVQAQIRLAIRREFDK